MMVVDNPVAQEGSTSSGSEASSRPKGRGKPMNKKRGRAKDKENEANTSGDANSSGSPVKQDESEIAAPSPAQPEVDEGDDAMQEDEDGKPSADGPRQDGGEDEAPVAMEVEGDEDSVVVVEKVVPAPATENEADPMETGIDDAAASAAATSEAVAPEHANAKAKPVKGAAKSTRKKKAPAAATPAAPPSALEIKYQSQLDDLCVKWQEMKNDDDPDYHLSIDDDLLEKARACELSLSGGDEASSSSSGAAAADSSKWPDDLSSLLGRLVQGSRLPLKQLSQSVLQYLSEALLPCTESLSEEMVQDKIRSMAERKAYGVLGKGATLWDDTSALSMLVWEAPDYCFAASDLAALKDVRSDRKHLGNHMKALQRLIEVSINFHHGCIHRLPVGLALIGNIASMFLEDKVYMNDDLFRLFFRLADHSQGPFRYR